MIKNVPLQVMAVLIAVIAVMIFLRQQPGLLPEADSLSRLEVGARAIKMRSAYLDKCASCHGARGEGGVAASIDFSSAEAVASLSRADMIKSLDARHSGRLPELVDPKEAIQIVDFIREYLMLPAPYEDAGVGRRVYSDSCSVCHGERGDGASWAQNSLYPAPRDFASADPNVLARADMIAAVTFGKPNTAMMPFATQLTPEEIAATVDYILIAFMSGETGEAGTPASPAPEVAPGDAAIEPVDVPAGDASAGRALYLVNCQQCHGQNGDGEGRRAYFMQTKPADFTSGAFRMRMNRARLFTAISHGVVGSPMPAWEKVLNENQIADLAAYLFETFVAEGSPDEATMNSDADSQKKN